MRRKLNKFPADVFSYYFNEGKISNCRNKNLWNELMTQKFKDLEISYLSGCGMSNVNFASGGNSVCYSECKQDY